MLSVTAQPLPSPASVATWPSLEPSQAFPTEEPIEQAVGQGEEERVALRDLPAPQLALVGMEQSTVRGRKSTRYRLSVRNWSAYPDDLFQASPNLAPIGRNTRASRTVVQIYSADGRRLYGFVAFSSAANLQRLWFAVREGPAPPDKVYVVLEDRLRQKRYRSNLVSLKDAPQLRDPPSVAASHYVVPEGGVAELLKFIEDLRQFRPNTRQQRAEHTRKAPKALKTAAKKILALEKDELSVAFQMALRVLLEDRVRTIRNAGPEQQQETVAQVKTFLTAKAETELHPQDASLAMSAARALEYSDNQQLAVQAYRSFAEMIAKSNDPKLIEMAKTMDGAARSLEWLGKEMETILQRRGLPEGLLLYLPFEKNTFGAVEEITYVRDLSRRNNHGCGRGVSVVPDGKVGGALVVDDGGLRLPGNLLNKATDYTVTAWIKRAADQDRLILYQERFGAGTTLLEMDFFPPNGRPRAKVWNRRKTPDHWLHFDGDGMATGQWHFVTFTVTGAGTRDATLKSTVDGRTHRCDFQMLDVLDPGYGFVGGGKGMIDELAIFNRALSDCTLGDLRAAQW